jgi:PAS domain S-box-containing protein
MSKELKILFLEDNEDDVVFIERELSKAGFTFVPLVVDTRPEFEDALRSFRPDVILSDHSLPEFNSAEALKVYQSEKQKSQLHAPFILVTGAVSEEFAVQCIKDGASDYILKDRLKRLPSAINSALEKQRSKLDKKRSETEKELIHRISKIFSSINTLEEDMKMSLAEICNQYSIDAAEAWITSIDASCLKLVASYSLNGTLNYPTENDLCLDMEGLMATAWKSKENVFTKEIQQEGKYIRKEFAEVNQLRSILAVPVIFRNEVTAVLAFYSKQPKREANDIVVLGNNLLSQLASDIRRKKTEVELNNFFTLSPDIISIVGTDGYVKKINPAATAILGYTEEDILAQPYIRLIHPEDHELTAHEIEKLRSTQTHNYFENRLITKNGDVKWLAWTVIPVEKNSLVYAIGKDITERKTAEEKMRLLNEELNKAKLKKQQEITSAVIAAQEAERQEIGRELHDNINQILVSARLHIGICKMNPENKAGFLEKADGLIDTSIKEIRALSHTLIAPILQENNFAYVIKDLAIELHATTGLHVDCQLNLTDESKIPDKLKLNLYRIIQEQLHNIVKYAKATNVKILVEQSENSINLIVSDNGIGFDMTQKSKGVGFLNMQTRVSEFNGEITITSALQQGCTIEVLIPIIKE